jgi:hypothetical protein
LDSKGLVGGGDRSVVEEVVEGEKGIIYSCWYAELPSILQLLEDWFVLQG